MNGKSVYGEAFGTRDEAEADRIKNAPHPGEVIAPKSEVPTFQTWAWHCMQPGGRYARNKAASTLKVRESFRLNHIEGSAIGKKRLDRITPQDCQNWIDRIEAVHWEMVDGERVDHASPAEPATVQSVAGFAKALMNAAVKEGYVRRSPLDGVELPTVRERENRVLSYEEAEKLQSPTDRIGTMMLLACRTGMERSALRFLQWSHVKADRIEVHGTKNAFRKAPVPITADVFAAIQQMPKRSVFVFTTESGKPLSERNIDRDFRRRAREIGLPDEMRLHDLRGSFITFLIDQGENPKVVQRLARHGSHHTTLKAYARSVQSSESAAITTLGLKLGKKPESEEKKA